MTTLTSKQRRYLKGLAHPLSPVVQIGVKGMTAAVVAQIDQALEDHELIKVKAGRECPDDRAALKTAIETGTGAVVVQVIGRVYVLFRRRAKSSDIKLPR